MTRLGLIFFMLIGCFVSLHGQIQPEVVLFYRYVNEADYWALENQPSKAIKLYEKAQHKAKLPPQSLYLMAKCYGQLKNKKKAKSLLIELSLHAPFSISRGLGALDTTIFKPLFGPDYEAILSKVNINEGKKKLTPLTDSLATIIKSMEALDQQFVLDKQREQLDSLHTVFFKLICQHGYLGFNTIGTDVGSIMLLHLSNHNFEVFQSELIKNVNNFQSSPFEYANMSDYLGFKYDGDAIGLYAAHPVIKVDDDKVSFYIENRLKMGVSIFYNGFAKNTIHQKKPMFMVES